MKIYISGPMTGLVDLNFPAFNAAAARLRELGFDVINPAELNPDRTKSWQECMRVDIKALCDCDAIALLDGYQTSKGARLEIEIAEGLGIPVVMANRVGGRAAA